MIVLLLIGLMVWGTWASTHKPQLKAGQSTISNEINTGSDNTDGSKTKVSNEKSFMDSIGVPKYYQKPSTEVTTEEKQEADATAMQEAPADAQAALAPSTGLTSDDSKAFNADGTINPDYSYLTTDNVIPVIQDDIQRLINPVYGQWTGMQQFDRTDINGKAIGSLTPLSNMFSQDAALQIGAGETGQDVTNIYADWNKDFYGGEWENKTSADPIIGVNQGYNCDFVLQNSTEDHIDCYVDVEYTGKSVVDGIVKQHSVKKEMILHYKVNYDETAYSSRRILLTSVEQK